MRTFSVNTDPKIVREEAILLKENYKTMYFSIDNGRNAYEDPYVRTK